MAMAGAPPNGLLVRSTTLMSEPFRSAEMSVTSPVDVFLEPADRLSTIIGGATVMASRSSSALLGQSVTVSTPPADAFGMAYWLQPVESREFWSEDGFSRVPISPRSGMHIVDLQAGGSVRYDAASFDAVNVRIPFEVLRALADQIGVPHIHGLRVPEPWQTFDGFVSTLETSLLFALKKENDVEPLAAQHLMLALVAHVAQRYGDMRVAPPALRGALSDVKLRHAKALLADDLDFHTPLSEIARECDLSPSYFSSAFKRATGKSPSVWLMTQRLARAKDLLAKDDMDLTEIGLQCGFADQSHFTRSFSREFGISPGAWRRLRR
jgi:AraC family transcriptional regulator